MLTVCALIVLFRKLLVHCKAKIGGHQNSPVICHYGALFLCHNGQISCFWENVFANGDRRLRTDIRHLRIDIHLYSLTVRALIYQFAQNQIRELLSAIPMRALLCNQVPVRKQELLSTIPMCALVCDRIPLQKQVRLHATNVPKVRNNTIPLRALEANLCDPFCNAENEKFVFCRFAKWKKTSPRQCAQRDQSDQNRSFWQNAHMGIRKKCAYGYHNARINLVCT